MTDFFFDSVIYSSIYGSIVIIVVCLLRHLLKRSPRTVICALWLLAALRLLCPFRIESSLSLVPEPEAISLSSPALSETDHPALQQPASPVTEPIESENQDVATEPSLPQIHENIEISTETTPVGTPVTVPEDQPIPWQDVVVGIWITGVALMLLYCVVSYLRLYQLVRDAVLVQKHIYESPKLQTAFVLGIFRPRIFLPTKIDAEIRAHLVAHEKSHIARLDPVWKLIGFLTLSVHWFNPLVWVFYILLCRDIEIACDESVIRAMDTRQRKAYSNALVSFSTNQHTFSACPVSFAEDNIRQRILRVLNYRKPGFWLTALGVIAVLFVAICFLTSPKTYSVEPLPNLDYAVAENYTPVECNVYEDCSYSFLFPNGAEQITVNGNYYLFAPELSLDDRIRFIESQEALLELLPDIRNCSFLVLDNYSSRSDSDADSAFYGIQHTATWHQALVTIQLLEGDYVNYGYAFAKADDLARQLNWEREIMMGGNPVNAMQEAPYLLNLVYPCFTTPYVTEDQIAASQMVALELYSAASRDTEEAFLAQREVYAAQHSIPFTPTGYTFGYGGASCPMKIQTTYIEIFVNSNYQEDRTVLSGTAPYWWTNLPVLFDALDFQEAMIAKLNHSFDYQRDTRIPVQLTAHTPTGLTSYYNVRDDFMYVKSITLISGEYIWEVYRACMDGTNTEYLYPRAKCLLNYYYFYDMDFHNYQLNRQYELHNYYDEYDSILGREYTGPQDIMTHAEWYLHHTLDFDGDPIKIFENMNNSEIALGVWLVREYGEDAFQQIMLDPDTAEALTGRSFEELIYDWFDYLEHDVVIPPESLWYEG